MSDDASAPFAKTIDHLEHCLTVLEQVAIASHDLEFLQTFLTNAKGYLSKDISPDTEALENWDTPENQAMIRRFITHVTQEIRLIIEAWQQAHPGSEHASWRATLETLLAGLEPESQGLHRAEPMSPDSAINGNN